MFWIALLFVGAASAQYAPPVPVTKVAQVQPQPQIQTYPYEGSRLLDTSIEKETPGQVELPKNSRINIQDKQLQYTHGFSDEKTGTSVSEQGSLLSTNEGWEYVIVKKGSYSYISPEGIPITVNYIADHNGFRLV